MLKDGKQLIAQGVEQLTPMRQQQQYQQLPAGAGQASAEAHANNRQSREETRSRFKDRLAAERSASAAGAPLPGPDLDDETPASGQGSAIGEDDGAQDLAGDYDQERGALDDDDEDPDDDAGTPSEDDQEADGQEIDWEQRYVDLQSETQQIREQRGEMDREHADAMAQVVDLRFQVEDTYREARSNLEAVFRMATGNAQQFRNINWSQVPPDQIGELQQRAQQAMAYEQQVGGMLQQFQQQQHDALDQVKQREAAVSKVRLKRTIPDWSQEKYGALREFAVSNGYKAERFNDITDAFLIEAINSHMQLTQGAQTVENVVTNKRPKPPRNRNRRGQPRDDKGQFARKQTVPNERGSFADRHKHRLRMERQGRR